MRVRVVPPTNGSTEPGTRCIAYSFVVFERGLAHFGEIDTMNVCEKQVAGIANIANVAMTPSAIALAVEVRPIFGTRFTEQKGCPEEFSRSARLGEGWAP